MKKLAVLICMIGLLWGGKGYGEFVQNGRFLIDTNNDLTWQAHKPQRNFSKEDADQFIKSLSTGWRFPAGEELLLIRGYIISQDNDTLPGGNYWTDGIDEEKTPLAIMIYHFDDQDPIKYNTAQNAKILAVRDGYELPAIGNENKNFGCFICSLFFYREL